MTLTEMFLNDWLTNGLEIWEEDEDWELLRSGKKVKIESFGQTWTGRTNRRTNRRTNKRKKIVIPWAPDGAGRRESTNFRQVIVLAYLLPIKKLFIG